MKNESFIVWVKKKPTYKKLPLSELSRKVSYRINLRSVDDKLIEAIQELDIVLDKALSTIVHLYPNYIVDYFLDTTYNRDIGPGGVRIFSGSRKKEQIKLKILDLVSYVQDSEAFMERMGSLGLIRGIKEKILKDFVDRTQTNPIELLKQYGDPFYLYKRIYYLFVAYEQLKDSIIRVTFNTLSKIVLSRYRGWKSKRSISNKIDYLNYEEDVQNSTFSIDRALSLYDRSKIKSFFSYVTGWIKEGISSNPYKIDNADLVTESPSGKLIKVRFESIDYSDNAASILDKDTFHSYISELSSSSKSGENQRIIDFFTGSFPIPNEVRVFFRLLELKEKNVNKRRD